MQSIIDHKPIRNCNRGIHHRIQLNTGITFDRTHNLKLE